MRGSVHFARTWRKLRSCICMAVGIAARAYICQAGAVQPGTHTKRLFDVLKNTAQQPTHMLESVHLTSTDVLVLGFLVALGFWSLVRANLLVMLRQGLKLRLPGPQQRRAKFKPSCGILPRPRSTDAVPQRELGPLPLLQRSYASLPSCSEDLSTLGAGSLREAQV